MPQFIKMSILHFRKTISKSSRFSGYNKIPILSSLERNKPDRLSREQNSKKTPTAATAATAATIIVIIIAIFINQRN